MVSTVELGAVAGASLVVVAAVQHFSNRLRRRHYPPGPPALPIVGNVHQLPVERQELKFHEWSSTYGEIVYVRLFQTPTIIINSVDVARELMEKRGANFSERPPFTLLNDLLGWDNALTNFSYSDPRFRKHRKWIQDGIQNREALQSFQHIQHREVCILLQGFLDAPCGFEAHIKRLAASLIIEIAYGHRVISLDDELLSVADTALTGMVRIGTPGADLLGILVEFFPILKHYPLWLPGSGFKVKTNEIRGYVRKLLDMPYEMVRDRAISGEVVPCLTASLIEQCAVHDSLTPTDENDIKGAAGVLYAAGTDTSVAFMTFFILAMVRCPEVFKKAQEEIDRVIGNERLPDFDDRLSLPYLDCILKEVLRWACPVPLGLPHRSANIDIFRGYEIPAKAMVIPNVWTMFRDPQAYPDPEKFWPERFEGLDKARADEIDPKNIIFGFGRRQCPGQQLAEGTGYLMAARVVATMDITRATDKHGNEVIPSFNVHPGVVLHPKSFKCTIRPRSDKTANMIRQMNLLAT